MYNICTHQRKRQLFKLFDLPKVLIQFEETTYNMYGRKG